MSCFTENAPTEGRFHFLHEKRKSAVRPDFHPALIVSWFWLREKALFKYFPRRDKGLGEGLVHSSADCGKLQPATGAVGRGNWSQAVQRRNSHHTPRPGPPYLTSLISLPCARTRFSSTSTFYLCGFLCRQCPLNSAWLSLRFFKPLVSPLPKSFLQPSGGRHLSSAPSATIMYFSSLTLCILFGQEMQFNQFYF